MISGIYSITNKANGKVYIGQTVNFKDRFRLHNLKLRKGTHENSLLQRAWNKYGKSNFEFKILEYVRSEHLTQREQWWMDLRGAYLKNYGYNLNPSASDNPMKGRNHTAETKAKISEKAKNRIVSEESRKKLSQAARGKAKNSSIRVVSAKEEPEKTHKSQYVYIATSPEGLTYIFDNLAKFCRENKLTLSHFRQCLVYGKFYKGWSGYRTSNQQINQQQVFLEN